MTCCDHPGPNSFRPDFDAQPLTLKFYARHETMLDTPAVLKKVEFYKTQDKKFETVLHPRTENGEYGWLNRCRLKYTDNIDRDLQYYARESDELCYILKHIIAEDTRYRATMKKS